MDDVAAALAAEASLLKATLQRNKAQHRRSKYYRALHGGAAVLLAQLEPGRERHRRAGGRPLPHQQAGGASFRSSIISADVTRAASPRGLS